MKKFLLAIVTAAFCMGALAEEGSNHHNTYMTSNSSTTAAVSMEQKNDVRIGGNAPAMSAASFDCNIVSVSYSVLIWSYGKSKCEKGSVVWRDVYHLVTYADVLGLDADALAEAIQRRVCANRKMRKVVGTCPARIRVAVVHRDLR